MRAEPLPERYFNQLPSDVKAVRQISATTLLDTFPELQRVGFIKVDVEGAERTLLPALGPLLASRPLLLVTVHEVFLQAAADVVYEWLRVICAGQLFTVQGAPFARESRSVEEVLCRAGGWQ